ncbi:hypothetical protein QTP88_002865 [Uroleucon formosanum]
MRPGCKQRSVVWEIFRKNSDGKVVTCQVCKKEFKYFGNTTNLKEHLKRMHPFKLNTVPGNKDDPSDQLQTINNASGPSTSSASFISPSQSVTSKQYTWTSDCNKSYLTVTCHFIHNNRLHSPVLATREVKDSHTGLNIATALTHIFNEWSIANKIVTIVSDNGSNIKNAINEHLLKYHHPCVAHTLNLSVNEAINGNFDVHQILKKCRAIVGHYKHSSLATGKLRDLQSQMNLPLLKVKQDVSTRWNSSLTMIERLLTIKIPLTASMSSLPRAPDCLNASEWEVISDCVKILKPFKNITSELSGENYPTISLVIPLIQGFQYILKNLRTETTIGIEFKNKLIDVVGRRLGNLEKDKIVAKSTLLDPRLKKTAFGLQENADNAHKWICEELTNMIRAKNDNTEITESDTTQSTSSANICSVWKHFDDKVAQRSGQRHVKKTRDNCLFIAAYVINKRGKGEYKMFENSSPDNLTLWRRKLSRSSYTASKSVAVLGVRQVRRRLTYNFKDKKRKSQSTLENINKKQTLGKKNVPPIRAYYSQLPRGSILRENQTFKKFLINW